MGLNTESRDVRKLRAAARRAARHLPADLPPGLALTDPDRVADPVALAWALPRGWGLVYRHFGVPGAGTMARALARVCHRRGLALLIAGDPGLACQVGATGVHWPEARLAEARRWQGRFRLTTASAHPARATGLGLLGRGWPTGVDALLVSTVFASASPSAGAAMGALRLRDLAKRAAGPIYALGGVDAETAGSVAGWAGLAAVDGALRFAERPEQVRSNGPGCERSLAQDQ